MLRVLVGCGVPALLATTVVTAIQIPLGPDPNGAPFVFRFAKPTALDRCAIQVFQTGEFGGLGWPAQPVQGVRSEYVFRTGSGGKPARTLKASVWCPGSTIALVDVPALGTKPMAASVWFKPLRDLSISGRVLPADDGVDLTGAELIVWYKAHWLCEFFALTDCWTPQWEIARTRIAPDKSFEVKVPDFAADPALARFRELGAFGIGADRSAPPYNYRLEMESAPGGAIPVSTTYSRIELRPRRH